MIGNDLILFNTSTGRCVYANQRADAPVPIFFSYSELVQKGLIRRVSNRVEEGPEEEEEEENIPEEVETQESTVDDSK